jgi:hypothetical protein
MGRTRISGELYRARRALEKHGILEAEALVEHRRDTQQLRIGVRQLEINEG